MMKCFKSALCVLAVCTCAMSSEGATLLSEDWNSGTINALVWNVVEDQNSDIELEDQGGGDYALALRGLQGPDPTTPAWSDNIRSVSGFARADQLVIEFLTWIKPGINTQVGIHGPFHNAASSLSYQNIEAGLDFFVNDIRTSEATYDGANGIQSGASQPVFTSDLTATNSKANALMVRVSLDAVRGSKFEYSTNAGADPFTTIHDTLGNLTYNGQGVKNTGSAANVWVGFGQGAGLAGTTMIDNIVLKSIPEPSSAVLLLASLATAVASRMRKIS